jgi:hypothetical protein
VCNEAENMKRNCPSVKKNLERNTLPDAMVENCDTDIDGKPQRLFKQNKCKGTKGGHKKNDVLR